MAKRHNHYEAAFEDYLRAERCAYVAVDERRRALDHDAPLKSVDFILSPAARADEPCPPRRWLVDVKGRRFPSGSQYWRNWTTEQELRTLVTWEERFGGHFEAVLVFAYELVGTRSPTSPDQIFWRRERPYAFLAVPARRYEMAAKPLSARWGTVNVPAAVFREIAVPLADALARDPTKHAEPARG